MYPVWSDKIMISRLQIIALVPGLYIQGVQEIYNHRTNRNRIKLYLLGWFGLGLIQDSS
jgi:TM2 domain-containing membrane protein YozV